MIADDSTDKLRECDSDKGGGRGSKNPTSYVHALLLIPCPKSSPRGVDKTPKTSQKHGMKFFRKLNTCLEISCSEVEDYIQEIYQVHEVVETEPDRDRVD